MVMMLGAATAAAMVVELASEGGKAVTTVSASCICAGTQYLSLANVHVCVASGRLVSWKAHHVQHRRVGCCGFVVVVGVKAWHTWIPVATGVWGT
jgi:hypothetical protein